MWCSSTLLYMWAEFDGLSTGKATCPFYFLDPDYEYGNGGGSVGNSGGNGYATSPVSEITNTPIDAAVWITQSNPPSSGTAALYIGTSLDPACKGSFGPLLDLGASVSWK